ncbi:hypothetical protein [Streptomyces sp. NPDC051567]|uniref:hypothetical protein n=1 Tax=Streptomyces sp. NPDC051567 TaxID=3365660 RepID=UPI0037ABAA4C
MSDDKKGTAIGPVSEETAYGDPAFGGTGPEVLASGRPEPVVPALRANRKAVGLVAGVLAVAVLAGGGFWVSDLLGRADRSAPTHYWTADGPGSSGTAEPVPTVPPNELMAKLLPIPSGYYPGPDIHREGNNYSVPGARAVQEYKDKASGLSGEQRAQRDKVLDGLKLKGTAGRSYVSRVLGEPAVEIELTQAEPQFLAKIAEFTKTFLKVTGDGREGPKADGFPDATCVLLREGPDRLEERVKIESISCVAVQGDVLVHFRAYGSTSLFLSASDAVSLFTRQLNHLKSPGESV